MKVSELQGAALDWAVAKCEGVYAPSVDADIDGTQRINYGGMYPEWSTDWAQGGPIIEREGMQLWAGQNWNASMDSNNINPDNFESGPTPLIAAMRCYVAGKLGEEIELPEELIAEAL